MGRFLVDDGGVEHSQAKEGRPAMTREPKGPLQPDAFSEEEEAWQTYDRDGGEP
jgi:hypothetical protein